MGVVWISLLSMGTGRDLVMADFQCSGHRRVLHFCYIGFIKISLSICFMLFLEISIVLFSLVCIHYTLVVIQEKKMPYWESGGFGFTLSFVNTSVCELKLIS